MLYIEVTKNIHDYLVLTILLSPNKNSTIGQYLQCTLDPRISWFSHLDPSNTAYSLLDPIKYINIEVPFPYISIKWAYSPCQSIIDDVPIHQKRTSKFPADPERMTKSGKRLQFANRSTIFKNDKSTIFMGHAQ